MPILSVHGLQQRFRERLPINIETPAPGYARANLRFGTEQQLSVWRLQQFVRINNLFDRNYIGSVIVGDNNKRYDEPAPGRNWMLGVSAQYIF